MLQHKYSFEALGTPWAIETDDEIPEALKKKIHKRIDEFDKTYSRFRPDSLVSTIAKEPGEYSFPIDAKKLFDFYKNVYDVTGGKVTPLIGDTIARAGYDANYSFQPKAQKPVPTWDVALEWDGSTLTTTRPITLDFGAAGKGYMIDIVAALLDAHNVTEYVVDASGDIRHKGTAENKVGLENPLDTTQVIGIINLQNRSLCASASNRRVWGEGLHHIFDPDTLAPTNEVIATWVVADEAMVADGLATALFFTDPRSLKETYDFEYVRVHANGSAEYSSFFKNKLF